MHFSNARTDARLQTSSNNIHLWKNWLFLLCNVLTCEYKQERRNQKFKWSYLQVTSDVQIVLDEECKHKMINQCTNIHSKIRHQTLNVQIVIDKEDIKFSKSHRKKISRVKTNRHSHSSMENNLSSTHFLPVCCSYLAVVRPGNPLSCLHARLNE